MMKTKMICGAATMMLASAPLLAASSSVDQQVRCFVKCNLSDASRRAVSECCRIISRLNVAKPALHRLIEGSAPGALRLVQAHEGPNSAWVQEYSDGDDEKRIEFRVENGEVRVWVNGEEVDSDNLHIEEDDGHVIILDGDGHELHNLPFNFDFDFGGMAFEWGGKGLPGQLRGILQQDEDGVWLTDMRGEHPNVMMGIVMDVPGEALRLHLGLAEGETTMISRVIEGLPADEAGLSKYDIVIAINGKSPASAKEIQEVLGGLEPDDDIRLRVIHEGNERNITITVKEYDPKAMSHTNTFFFDPDGQFPGGGEGQMEIIMEGMPLKELLELRNLGEWRGLGDGERRRIIVAPRGKRDAEGLHRELRERLERVERDRRDHDSPHTRPARPRRSTDVDDRLNNIDDRMRRLEELLEKLVEDAHRDDR